MRLRQGSGAQGGLPALPFPPSSLTQHKRFSHSLDKHSPDFDFFSENDGQGIFADMRESDRLQHKERIEESLCCFFFVIFVFFCGNSALVAAGRAGPFGLFCGKSMEVPFPENFAHKNLRLPGQTQSNPVKPSQTKKRGLTRKCQGQ
jgi:hypothetical protein